ncbi:NADPH-dependent FMN reductase [Streptomyces broussonetiae]|uniref:NADPH-dependent FMN reductase n=1 Tax=Streptomyces broussonetiae TaxID=2686304 RepID=UPI0035DDBBFA
MSERPVVLLLGGSTSSGSHTTATIEAAALMLTELGAEPLVWDLAIQPLPIVDPSCHGRPELYTDPYARTFAQLAAEADAFLIASPMYRGSCTGAVKNALDHLDVTPLSGKPVGLLAHGENLSAVQACDALRTVVRALRGIALPEQLVTVPGDFARSAKGVRVLHTSAARRRLYALCRALVELAHRLAGTADPVPAAGPPRLNGC